MKNKPISFLRSFLIIVFFYSCTSNIDIDFYNNKKEISVVSILMPDSIFKVYITQTSGIGEYIRDSSYKGYILENAHVTISDESGVLETSQSTNNMLFKSTNKATYNKTYHIKVSAPSLETVFAETIIPDRPHIEGIEIDKDFGVDRHGNTVHQVRVKFKDPGNKENFYEIETVSINRSTYEYDSTLEFQSGTYSIDPVVLAENYPDRYFNHGITFSDKLINGQEYEMKFQLPQYGTIKGAIVILRHVSDEYYRYRKQLEYHVRSTPTDIMTSDPSTGLPFQAQPVLMYTNIENGQGLFTGMSFDIDTLFL